MIFARVFVYNGLRFGLDLYTVVFTRLRALIIKAAVYYAVFRQRQHIGHIYTDQVEGQHKSVFVYGRLSFYVCIADPAQRFYR